MKRREPPFSSSAPAIQGARNALLMAMFLLVMGIWADAADSKVENPPKTGTTRKANAIPPYIRAFVETKEKEARAMAKDLNLLVAPEIWDYFDVGKKGDWDTAGKLFDSLSRLAGWYAGGRQDNAVGTPVWQVVIDTSIVLEFFAQGSPKYSEAFGRDIVSAVPPGAIYFGGTDPGRSLVTAHLKSHIGADPFYLITQNALADGRYLEYLRWLYNQRIRLPTSGEVKTAFEAYIEDAQRRLQHDQQFPDEPKQIRAGEEVTVVNNRVQVSGATAVMSVNGLITKTIFEQNPTREFYVEESFPLDWMFPHLSPAGPIMKVNRQPLPELSEEMMKADHDYWSKYAAGMIGDWLTYETSVTNVCAFAEKVFLKGDLSEFKGDPIFVRDTHAQQAFSKLRAAQAGLYTWRVNTLTNNLEAQKRVIKEADFAFRQALALCPSSAEVAFRYTNFLLAMRRVNDAMTVALSFKKIAPANPSAYELIEQLKNAPVNAGLAAMEQQFQASPTNTTVALQLFWVLLGTRQTNRAVAVIDRLLANPLADANTLANAANAYGKIPDLGRMETAIGRLALLDQSNPEAWYDLSAIQAAGGKSQPALQSLKRALEASDARLTKNKDATNLRAMAPTDPRFKALQSMPEFKALFGK